MKLTQVEYGIVKLFMENPGKALSREEILDAVWGKDYFGELKIVDVNIRRLRIKIEDDAHEADLCQYGVGLWVQVGKLKQAPRGVVRGPAERGARQRVNASQCEALAEVQFICPEHRKKEGSPKSELFGEGRHEPGLYHHRVGIWVQVERIKRRKQRG